MFKRLGPDFILLADPELVKVMAFLMELNFEFVFWKAFDDLGREEFVPVPFYDKNEL